MERCETIDTLNVQSPEGYNHLGRIYYKQGFFEQAIFYFEKAFSLNPNYGEAHYNLAHSFSQLNRFERAATHYREALKYNDRQATAHFNLGLIYHEAREHKKACDHLKKALDLDSTQFNAMSFLYWAESCLALGDVLDAKIIYEKAIHLFPDVSELHHNLAILCLKENEKKMALNHFRQALGLSPNNETAKHMVAALNQDTQVDVASTTYVRDLFNQYADYYDVHVKEKLQYRLPFYLRDAIGNTLNEKLFSGRILDLGCGTGLCGIYFRDLAQELIGVDISEKMVEKAKNLEAYDHLIVQDIAEYLDQEQEKFDFIIAADVFVYCGQLASLFEKIKRNLSSKGHFIFTIENLMSEYSENSASDLKSLDFCLQITGRFAHAPEYIRNLAQQYHFEMLLEENLVLRMNNEEPVTGTLFILKA